MTHVSYTDRNSALAVEGCRCAASSACSCGSVRTSLNVYFENVSTKFQHETYDSTPIVPYVPSGVNGTYNFGWASEAQINQLENVDCGSDVATNLSLTANDGSLTSRERAQNLSGDSFSGFVWLETTNFGTGQNVYFPEVIDTTMEGDARTEISGGAQPSSYFRSIPFGPNANKADTPEHGAESQLFVEVNQNSQYFQGFAAGYHYGNDLDYEGEDCFGVTKFDRCLVGMNTGDELKGEIHTFEEFEMDESLDVNE